MKKIIAESFINKNACVGEVAIYYSYEACYASGIGIQDKL